MLDSQIQIIVLLVAVLGTWICKNQLFFLGNQTKQENQDSLKRIQNGSTTQYVFKAEENNVVLRSDSEFGIDCVTEFRRTLTYIMCIYIVMGTTQVKIEHVLGERLVTDRFQRLELLHDIKIEEGKVFKVMREEIYPELLNAVKNGETQDIWYLTEKFIDFMHLYSAKLLGYGSRLKSGIENAKAAGKLENVSLDVTKEIAFLAGAEKCVIEEWLILNKVMYQYLDWVGNRLKLQNKIIKNKKLILDAILESSHVSGMYADSYVSRIGVTNLTSKHNVWFQKRQGEEVKNVTTEWINELEANYESKDTNNLFLMFGFNTDFTFNDEKIGVKNTCAFQVLSD